MTKYLVLDTNILLLDANNLLSVPEKDTVVVLPETVLDEIDSKKSGHSEIAYQAREFNRLLNKATYDAVEEHSDMVVTKLELYGQKIHIVMLDNYLEVDTGERAIANDNKIIHVARKLHSDNLNVEFMSNDGMCRIRAKAAGLNVTDLKEVEKTKFEFIKALEVTPEVFQTLDNKSIIDIDPEYTKENYSYRFTTDNSDHMKLATISFNGKIKVLTREEETDLRKQALPPLNSEQLLMSKAIMDKNVDVVVCEALTGSGKTATAISSGMHLMDKDSSYNSIIYIRASVNDVDPEEEVGFLPGLEEKFAMYLHPMRDNVDTIVRRKYKNSPLKGTDLDNQIEEGINHLYNKYNISEMTTHGMRGRTFKNCYVIIDEDQNMTKKSLQKVLTRFGDGCKIILIGSNRQIDSQYVNKYTNGLSVILNDCTKENDYVNLFAINLSKVVRSNVAEWAERMYDGND